MFRKISSLLLILSLILSSFHSIGIAETTVVENDEKQNSILTNSDNAFEYEEVKMNEELNEENTTNIEVEIEENLESEQILDDETEKEYPKDETKPNIENEVEVEDELKIENTSDNEVGAVIDEESSEKIAEKDNQNESDTDTAEHSDEPGSKEQVDNMQIQVDPSEQNILNNQDIVTLGDTTYYLDNKKHIIYAEVLVDGIVKQIIEYYADTTIEEAQQGIHYVFEIDKNRIIKNAVKKEKNSGTILTHYEFYPKTKYGIHSKQIQYSLQVDRNGYLKTATKKEQGTGKNVTYYEYYPKTKYGSHSKQIQYSFQVDRNGYLKSATKKEQGTGKNVTYYEYYSKTKYGLHSKQIQYSFYLTSIGTLNFATKKEQGTGRNITYYEYYPNTKYTKNGQHGKQVEYSFSLDSSGYIKNAVKKEKQTGRNMTYYEYYPNTRYTTNGQHGKQIQYTFSISKNGYIQNASKKQKDTGKNIGHYEYYPNTRYQTNGQHGKQVQYTFSINSKGYIINAIKKEKNTGRNITYYEYYPNTVYGKHSKQIQYQFFINKQGYITKAYKLEAGTGKRTKEYRYQSNTRYGSHSSRITQVINLNIPNSNIVNPNKVYSYNQMVNDIKALKNIYPDLITYHSIGKSEYGRDIYAVSIGKGKPTAFINGSHHAREWLTTNLNMYMIEQYAKAYYRNEKIIGYDAKSILNGTTLWFVPMVNPDGVTLQQEGLKAFPTSIHSSLIKMNNGSQNFKRWKANAKGIDLNRQYDAGWSLINSPKAPSYQNYKGSKPVEAKETKAIIAFTNKIDPEIAVSYHSTGQILYWNYLQTGANYQRDLGMAKVISKLTGYSLFYPVGRPSGGGYTDWFIQSKKRPGFTPEIAKYVFESNPPLSEFTGAWNENKAVGLYVAQESLKLNKARK